MSDDMATEDKDGPMIEVAEKPQNAAISGSSGVRRTSSTG